MKGDRHKQVTFTIIIFIRKVSVHGASFESAAIAIIEKSKTNKPFRELKIGDCYRQGNSYYMKTEPVHDKDDTDLNCICLENGSHYHTYEDKVVRLVVIEGRVIG